MEIEIACPKCEWKPTASDVWQCGCGTLWNTFDTAGKCPSCGKVWANTQCQHPVFSGGCGRWSYHLDWYRNLDEEMRKEIERILNSEKVEVTQ